MKTQPTDADVHAFLDTVEDERKRSDSYRVLEIMKEITGEEPVMWGDSIVGFGSYHYKYATGREGDMLISGFSPRKTALTLYIMSGFRNYEKYLEKLGKHKKGKSCLYIKKLDDVDEDILRKMIKESVERVKKNDIHYE